MLGNVIFQSLHFRADKIVSTYARLYSNGEVMLFDVDRRHKTIRERATTADALSVDERAKLKLGEQVLLRGLTTQERAA